MKLQNKAVELAKSIKGVVKMSEETANIMLAAVVTGSNLLLYGPPGTGKTLFSSTVSKAFVGAEQATRNIVQKKTKKAAPNGQVDMFSTFSDADTGETGDAADLVAGANRPVYGLMRFSVGTQAEQLNGSLALGSLMKGAEVPEFRPHLDAAVFHADEVNRATPPVSSLLMEHLGESRASIGAYHKELPRRMAILTMNPSGSGVFDMDDALYDRMTASVTVEYMGAEDLEETGLGSSWSSEMPVLGTLDDILSMWDESVTMAWDPQAKTMAAMMIRATTACKLGNKAELVGFPACCADCEYSGGTAMCKEVTSLSARAHRSLETMACGLAYLRGDKQVTVRHLELVAPYVIRHRVQVLSENGSKQELTRAKEAVKRLMSDASQAVDLITQARNGALRRKDVENVRQGKGQNLLTLESLNRIERLMTQAAQATMNLDPATMTVEELKKAVDTVPDDDTAKKLEDELRRRAQVTGVVDMDQLEDSFFQSDFRSPEGEALLSQVNWGDLLVTRSCETDLGVKASLVRKGDQGTLILDFIVPEAGEAYRKHLEANPIEGFTVIATA